MQKKKIYRILVILIAFNKKNECEKQIEWGKKRLKKNVCIDMQF